MNISKWKSHHYNLALLVIAVGFAGAFYWQGAQAAPPVKSPYVVGTHIEAVSNLNVYERSNDNKQTAVQCVQPAGATGVVINGPKKGAGSTWLEINWDTYCDGWSQIDGFLITQ